MKKLAVYTEGGTELGFIERLLLEIAGEKNIQIRTERRLHGANGGTRSRQIVSITGAGRGHEYFAQIINCTNDERVCSDIRSEYAGLVAQGFNAIIGMRDARGQKIMGVPNTFADIPKLKTGMRMYVPTAPINPTMILVVMETEVWFIAEYTHVTRISPQLGLNDVSAVVGFDPSVEPHRVESLAMPAETLDTIYQRASERYIKPNLIKRTVDSLDIGRIYLDLGDRIPELAPLVAAVDNFLS